jgi:hypothetical protein
MDPEQITASPTGEVVSPSPIAEPEVIETPAVSTEDQELATAQEAIEQAKTPEEKERARDGYQRRKEAKEYRVTQERARSLELELAEERGRRQALESMRVSTPEPQASAQAQPPQIPAPQLPPKPRQEDFQDNDGYQDQEAYFEALADYKAECKFIERDHQQNLARMQEEQRRMTEQGNAFVDEIIQAHPDFAEKMRLHTPSEAVGRSLGILKTLDTKAAIETAYYLASNPAELKRLNQMAPEAVTITLGQLAAKLALPPVQPNRVSNAPQPVSPVTSTEVNETFDPKTCDMDTYGRHHPACPSWLK